MKFTPSAPRVLHAQRDDLESSGNALNRISTETFQEEGKQVDDTNSAPAGPRG